MFVRLKCGGCSGSCATRAFYAFLEIIYISLVYAKYLSGASVQGRAQFPPLSTPLKLYDIRYNSLEFFLAKNCEWKNVENKRFFIENDFKEFTNKSKLRV